MQQKIILDFGKKKILVEAHKVGSVGKTCWLDVFPKRKSQNLIIQI